MTKQEIKKLNYFYYYIRRDETREPIGCVCLSADPYDMSKWARGVAICAKGDPFLKVKGRKLARGRCIRALNTRLRTERIMRSNSRTLEEVESAFDNDLEYKSEYNPIFTAAETRMLRDVL